MYILIFRYGVFLYSCTLRSRQKPEGISLTLQPNDTPVTKVSVILPTSEHVHHFTVCVSPLHSKYNDTAQFKQMIEMNILFGAKHFIFYNNSISPTINSLLYNYKLSNVSIHVLPWTLPGVSDAVIDIHYFGQLAALNDCLYRSMSTSQHVVFTDMDELIVPQGEHQSWTDIIRSVRPASVFVFQNVFFPERKEYILKDENNNPITPILTNQTNSEKIRQSSNTAESCCSHPPRYKIFCQNERESYIYSHGIRSKTIVRPERILLVGVHNVWLCVGPCREHNVTASAGLLHHYRRWEINERSRSTVTDKTICKYDANITEQLR